MNDMTNTPNPTPQPPTREQIAVIDEAMVERAARVLFEDPAVDGDWKWDDLVREDGPERAALWREHARLILEAALIQNGADR